MVQTLPPVPTTALSTLFQNSNACSIALKISSSSLPAHAGQLLPSLISSSFEQLKVATDSGTGLAVLRVCRYSGNSVSSGGGGSGDGNGGNGGDDSDGDHDGGCDDDGSAGAVAAVMTAVSVAILLRCMHSNPLTTALPADGATGAAAASATTVFLQRLRHQRHADLPASAHVRL